jgi:hypothetical protein
MQGSNLIFIVLPVVIPLVLGIGVALPFIADSRAGRRPLDGQSARGAARQPVDARALDQGLSPSRQLQRTPPGPARRAA